MSMDNLIKMSLYINNRRQKTYRLRFMNQIWMSLLGNCLLVAGNGFCFWFFIEVCLCFFPLPFHLVSRNHQQSEDCCQCNHHNISGSIASAGCNRAPEALNRIGERHERLNHTEELCGQFRRIRSGTAAQLEYHQDQ